MSTNVTLLARLGADPEIRFTQGGKAVASMRVVTSKKNRNADGSWGEDTEQTWYEVTAWEGLAENIVEVLSKGDAVIVVGRLYMDTYKAKDGTDRQALKVTASTVGPDLLRSRGAAPAGRPAAVKSEDPWKSPAQEEIPPF
jgi:single-strand DNA-binding protein